MTSHTLFGRASRAADGQMTAGPRGHAGSRQQCAAPRRLVSDELGGSAPATVRSVESRRPSTRLAGSSRCDEVHDDLTARRRESVARRRAASPRCRSGPTARRPRPQVQDPPGLELRRPGCRGAGPRPVGTQRPQDGQRSLVTACTTSPVRQRSSALPRRPSWVSTSSPPVVVGSPVSGSTTCTIVEVRIGVQAARAGRLAALPPQHPGAGRGVDGEDRGVGAPAGPRQPVRGGEPLGVTRRADQQQRAHRVEVGQPAQDLRRGGGGTASTVGGASRHRGRETRRVGARGTAPATRHRARRTRALGARWWLPARARRPGRRCG